MQPRRAQLSLFILIGCAIFILLLLTRSRFSKESMEPETLSALDTGDFASMHRAVEICLEQQLSFLVRTAAMSGGYLGIPPLPLEYHSTPLNASSLVPHYLYAGQRMAPTVDEVTAQLSAAMQRTGELCTKFSDPRVEFVADEGYAIADVGIAPHVVLATLYLPISLKQEDHTVPLGTFALSIPSNLSAMLTASAQITDLQYARGASLCWSCIVAIATAQDLKIEVIRMEAEDHFTLLYTLTGAGQPLFAFAHHIPLAGAPVMGDSEDFVYA